jgi:hypothetical protein
MRELVIFHMNIIGEDPGTPKARLLKGDQGQSVILIRGCVPPWLAEQTLDSPRHGAARACPWLSTALGAGSVRRGRGEDRYSQHQGAQQAEEL